MILRIESKLISLQGEKGMPDGKLILRVVDVSGDRVRENGKHQLSDPAVLGAMQSSDATVPAIYNVQKLGTPGAAVQFVKNALQE